LPMLCVVGVEGVAGRHRVEMGQPLVALLVAAPW
jgi:hypothetical protein